jgi:hypothetical protein
MSFRQPTDMPNKLRGMIKHLYGDGVIAKASDLLRKLRSGSYVDADRCAPDARGGVARL